MSKLLRITDHALVRYLERVKGVDVEALRHEIASKVARAADLGACGVRVGGFNYRIEGGYVVTVQPESRNDVRYGHRPRRGQRGEDA